MKSKIEKILILKKTSKLQYLIEKYGEAVVKNSKEYEVIKESVSLQESNTEKFINYFLKKIKPNQHVKIIADNFLNNENIYKQINNEEFDYVYSLGGDGTFLRAATLVKTGKPTFIGVNTDIKRSTGFYCTMTIKDDYESKINKLLEKEYKIKEIEKITVFFPKDNQKFCFVNDMHFGEKFSGRVSKYEIKLNERELIENLGIEDKDKLDFILNENKPLEVEVEVEEDEKNAQSKILDEFNNEREFTIKSSGILFSTYSGYSGWIKNCNSIHLKKYLQVLEKTNKKHILDSFQSLNSDSQESNIQIINDYKESVLNSKEEEKEKKNKIFYFIREPIISRNLRESNNPLHLEKLKLFDGTVTKMSLRSLCYEGSLIIDGSFVRNVEYNEEFILSLAERKLKIIENI